MEGKKRYVGRGDLVVLCKVKTKSFKPPNFGQTHKGDWLRYVFDPPMKHHGSFEYICIEIPNNVQQKDQNH